MRFNHASRASNASAAKPNGSNDRPVARHKTAATTSSPMLVMGSDDGDSELVSWGLGNVAQSRDSAEREQEDLFDLRATSSATKQWASSWTTTHAKITTSHTTLVRALVTPGSGAAAANSVPRTRNDTWTRKSIPLTRPTGNDQWCGLVGLVLVRSPFTSLTVRGALQLLRRRAQRNCSTPAQVLRSWEWVKCSTTASEPGKNRPS